MNISKKILILFLAFMLTPILFVGMLSFSNAKELLEDEMFNMLENIAELKTRDIEGFITERKSDIQASQSFTSIKENLITLNKHQDEPDNFNNKKAIKNLDDQLKRYQKLYDYEDIMLISTEGIILYASGDSHKASEPGNPLPLSLQSSFIEGSKGVFVSDIYNLPGTEKPFLTMMTAPLHDSSGNFIGVIAFEINMKSIYDLIQNNTGLGETGETLIAKRTDEGALFLNPLRYDPNAALKRKVSYADKKAFPIMKAVGGENGSGISIDYRGEEVLSSWRHIPLLKWGLVAKIDVADAFKPIDNLKNMVLLIAVTAMFVGSILAVSVAKSITDPIHALHRGTEIIGEGNLDLKVGTDVKDEIGQLSRAFDDMTAKLKQYSGERDDAEESLRKSELWLRSTYNSLDESVLVVSPDREILGSNLATETIFGYTTSELVDLSTEVLHINHEHYLEFGRRIKSAFDKGEVAHFEYKLKRKNGDEFPSEHTVSLLKDDSGKPMGIVSVVRDLTDRKRAEEELMRLSTAIEQSVETILITDPEGNIQYTNPAFEKTTGYSLKEAIGNNPRMLRSGKHSNDFYKSMWDTISHGNVWSGHLINKKKDGTLYEEDATISPVFESNGEIVNYVAVKRDVTYENMLHKARDYFTAVTSHELRTPLTKLQLVKMLATNLKKSGSDTEKMDEILSILEDSFDGLNRILTATTLLQDLNSTPAEKSTRMIFLYPLLNSCLESTMSIIEEKGRDIHFYQDLVDLPKNVEIKGNQDLIIKAIRAILSNAVKYTPNGKGIKLAARLEGNRAIVEVVDEGIGIPSEKMDIIFEPFFSLEDVLHHYSGEFEFKSGGLGLGLPIARMIVEQHGGIFKVQSDGQDKGTTVSASFLL